MAITKEFAPEQAVIWTHEVGGWGWKVETPAIIVKVTAKRVIIEVKTKLGDTVRRTVKPESLSVVEKTE